MEVLTHKYRHDPNAMVHNAYVGVASGTRTATRITTLNKNDDRLETVVTYGPGIPRGQSGRAATLVLGGLETTLDEVEYILEGIREKKFTPQRKPGEIAQMCQLIAERRNERIRYLRRNPSEAPKQPRRPKGLYLPVGYRMVQTREPGFKVALRVRE